MMQEFQDFFSDLFATNHWPPRWKCGYWSDFHGWAYITSDLLIWFSYFAMPLIIVSYAYRKKYELKYTNTYFLFAAFILLCGSTHLLDAAMFWTPMYRFNALIRFITAVTSLLTVYHLIKILPDAFREKTSVVLEREIAKRLEVERQLETANEGLKAFAYMASHDLQEPVRKISTFTSRLRATNEKKLDDKSIELLDKTIDASQRMSKIIQGILSLSSISSQVDFTTVNLNDVVKEAVSDLELKIEEANANVNVAELPSAKGNREYLVQLFDNLISNGIKFSRSKPIIDIFGERRDGQVLIHVKDNGIGMEQQQVKRIFNAFERMHSRDEFEGSGIGLAICKKIAEVHNGSISAQSEPGKGTVFTVTLPAS